MKTVNLNLYSFNELSDDAKQKAIESLSDINVDFEWWDWVYGDASDIGLNITGFDLGRGAYVNGEFINNAIDTAQMIISEHGETCETYKTAQKFIGDSGITNEDDFEDLEDEFLKSLCEDYRIILRNEYEYLTSEEAIIDTITANDYYFTEDGKLSNL